MLSSVYPTFSTITYEKHKYKWLGHSRREGWSVCVDHKEQCGTQPLLVFSARCCQRAANILRRIQENTSQLNHR
jgi:hypothetical protein